MSKNKAEQLRQKVRHTGILRARDLKAQGIPREYLWQLQQKGLLERAGRGIYRRPGAQVTENHSLVEAAQRVPRGVICLLSALRFHDLTTQTPFEVWVAIDRKMHRPNSINDEHMTPLNVVRFSGEALTEGVEEYKIEGVTVKIYSPAKTVADCFKYRNKIGVDVAVEALRDCWQKRRASADELWHYAKICRVANVMRPYMEAITAA
ncbi:MAG: AbiEi antitoxin N-terminal domain-containing protein [Acidobacteria bacterium]|nr:AbiEi antitoxin N-terminal domain-containing protein [Acidobacteriota bacterium]